ncbi:type I 3-dehydroquinate dehydratase [Terrisporobacter sp.]|uniref:type I 3-dehydroquinate dehydratase n=1 Tax=Terrisporobacter sp. TaxID=1965305 RepID=UPI00263A0BF9|nr:type I 3-dehydroquinate dehydratase [Terrisporobacter sp.]
MKTVKVRNVVLGEGKPKICVPIVGVTKEEIIGQAKNLQSVPVDVVEWRVDWFENVFNIDKVKEVLAELREELKELPLLFTFRTSKEGGEKSIETEVYVNLNKEVAATGLVDLIDVEVFTGDEVIKEVVEFAHSVNVKVVASNHDFDKTPSKGDIVSRLIKMQDLGADIPKIAVMPKCKLDVLELLEATTIMSEQYANRPIITMSMAGQGVISRLCGEVFGSCLTFGAVNKASAPGQINVEELNKVLDIINKSI